MEKEIFEKAFIESLNKNFETHAEFFDFNFYTYPELGTSIFEINKCLILGFYRASITLTNNVLERVLKLALIYNEAGLGQIPIENWSDIFSGPNEKYGTKQLGNSIELCKKENLITEDEKNILFDTIRELMRNGFSHSDPSKILKNLPDKTQVFQATFSNPSDIKEIYLNYKSIPIFQDMQMDAFAKENAFEYFKFVFGLMKRLDERLKLKYNIN
ncbi:hypothetical protein [Flavobacterium humi]|uniref:Uncharacterized protein n=1 Tax=Flavobacterium humi TaxID=2562683 RepID=A0A4Z0L9K4_9FLAO|nr:hypothetical protein [Flavobacterium humi]TGD58255.1 hypothetical protein E4635_09635 [Flavobacterium humi]